MTWESDYSDYIAIRAASIRRLAYGLCGDWHLAEDLTQHAFLQLYRHWKRIDRATLDAYSRRIVVNAFLSDRRLRRRERVVAQPPDRPMPVADAGGTLDILAALSHLPARQRALIVLRHLEDISVAEAADLLGITEGTVKSQTARGLDKLRAALVVPVMRGE
jgi:RNA polymerase sigma-70 factor (sigma-E family)